MIFKNTLRRCIFGMLLFSVNGWAETHDRIVLHYDSPATDDIGMENGAKVKGGKSSYIKEALPLGNGRLGAMFNGGIDAERLLINEITCWGNSKRGLDAVAQSGTRIGAHKDLETVRAVYRDGKYGTQKGSMEEVSTRYLSSKEPLGNYARFTDVLMENFFLQEIHSAGIKKHPDIPAFNKEIIAGNRSYRTQGVRTDRFKYFKYHEHTPVIEELYDLKNDPHEQNNLISNPEYAEVLDKLRKKTEELKAEALQ